MTSLFASMAYAGIPFLVLIMVYVELDPPSYILQYLLSQHTTGYFSSYSITIMCYVTTLIGTYHNALMTCFLCSGLIYISQCGQTLLKIWPLFLTRIVKLYDLNVLTGWFKCGQISHNMAEPLVRNGMCFFVLCLNVGMCCGSYVLIRLSHQLSVVTIMGSWAAYVGMAGMTIVGWGVLTMVHSETKYSLSVLVKLRVIRKIRTVRERRIHFKVVRAMRPIAIPVGFGGHTFFRAKKSNELMFGMIVLNNTVSLLLL